jgi:hypothetical protein
VSKLDGTPQSDFTRYWVSSLEFGERSASRLLGLCRGYWSVENKNHWKRDAIWHEDESRVRHPNIVRALAILRSVLLAPLASAGHLSSLPQTLESMAHDPAKALALIRNQRLT